MQDPVLMMILSQRPELAKAEIQEMMKNERAELTLLDIGSCPGRFPLRRLVETIPPRIVGSPSDLKGSHTRRESRLRGSFQEP